MSSHMPIGEKLRVAREAQIPRVSMKEAGALLGIDWRRLQSYELGKARPKKVLESIVKKLSIEWGIKELWFWDGKDTPPYSGENRNRPVVVVMTDVKVYLPNMVGEQTLSEKSVIFARLDGEAAGEDAYGVEIANDRLLPNINPGDIAWCRPLNERRPKIGYVYGAVHKHLRAQDECESRVIVFGECCFSDSRFALDPLVGDGEIYPESDLEDFALVVGWREVRGERDYSDHWKLDGLRSSQRK